MPSTGAFQAYQGLPVWARTVGMLGLPTLIAVWLLWVVVGGVVPEARAQTQLLNANVQREEAHQGVFETFMVEHSRREEMLLMVMQQLCVNSAATQVQRDGCFPR